MKKFPIILTVLLLWCLPAAAATWTQDFMNSDDGTNAIYLWMDPASSPDAQVKFNGTTFGGGYAGWTLESNLPMQQFMSGPALPAFTGGIYVSFSGEQPFSFQWAEVQWKGGTSTLLGSGTGAWNSSGGWDFSSSTFTHTGDIVPLPIPASVLLLGTGFLGMGLLGWRRKRS